VIETVKTIGVNFDSGVFLEEGNALGEGYVEVHTIRAAEGFASEGSAGATGKFGGRCAAGVDTRQNSESSRKTGERYCALAQVRHEQVGFSYFRDSRRLKCNAVNTGMTENQCSGDHCCPN